MSDVYAPRLSGPTLEKGFSSKGYVTAVVQGQTVKVPTAQIKIIPPQGGTAAVSPRNQSTGKTK
jgi:hypothetical protein